MRGRGEQHHVAGVATQGRNRVVAIGVGADQVRFVDEHDIPQTRLRGRQYFGPLDVIERGDRQRAPSTRVDLARQGRRQHPGALEIDDLGSQTKAIAQFVGPLIAQARRRQQQHPLGRPPRQQL